ncbi:hypothetical protein K0M31_012241, partial [Melipona bicolor]
IPIEIEIESQSIPEVRKIEQHRRKLNKSSQVIRWSAINQARFVPLECISICPPMQLKTSLREELVG